MPSRSKRSDKGGADGKSSELSDTIDLLKRYLLQETVGPLRNLGRILGLGFAGAFLLAIGLVLLDIAVLRAIQEEAGSTFSGDWTWVPYLFAVVVAIALAGLAIFAALRGRSGRDRAAKA